VPEAETALLGCCLLDAESPDSTIAKALSAGITPGDFFDPANRIIFHEILRLQNDETHVTLWMLLGHLKNIDLLANAGGQGRIADLTNFDLTTTHAKKYIAEVLDSSRQRKLILSIQRILEQARQPGAKTADLVVELHATLDRIADLNIAKPGARSLMKLTATDDERRAANLLGNGFLRRGQGALLPGATGIGKSSLSMQALVLWALGKPFFGIMPQGPLTSLLVQAENDDIDLVEMRDGVCDGLSLTATDRETVARRVFVLTVHERGAELMRRLESEVKRIKPDLLVLDPLFAFMEGAVKDQEAASYFLRALLQPFLVRHNLAAIILHHTNKPPSGKEKSTWQGNDFSYAGSGSIEFANWARAVILLRSIGKPGVFELMLPKRGKRAGITDASGAPITSIMIRHARIPGKIFWELADAADTRRDETNARGPQVVKAFFSYDKGKGVSLETLARRLKCSTKTVRRELKDGKVKTDDGETLVVRDSKVFAEEVI
jgi:replicative DNA helicase